MILKKNNFTKYFSKGIKHLSIYCSNVENTKEKTKGKQSIIGFFAIYRRSTFELSFVIVANLLEVLGFSGCIYSIFVT